MKTKRFTHLDLDSINRWLHRHNKEKVAMRDLPKLGFIVPGVAAGFIRYCEGDMSLFDSVVTNPLASSNTRHRALDAIMDDVKTFGGRHILGITEDAGTLERGAAHGFRKLPHVCLIFSKD